MVKVNETESSGAGLYAQTEARQFMMEKKRKENTDIFPSPQLDVANTCSREAEGKTVLNESHLFSDKY